MERCCESGALFLDNGQQTTDNRGRAGAGTPNRREVKLLLFKNMKVFIPQNVMK